MIFLSLFGSLLAFFLGFERIIWRIYWFYIILLDYLNIFFLLWRSQLSGNYLRILRLWYLSFLYNLLLNNLCIIHSILNLSCLNRLHFLLYDFRNYFTWYEMLLSFLNMYLFIYLISCWWWIIYLWNGSGIIIFNLLN